ncbi:hypothetical protein KAS08_00230 [Candidatus Pacearchaeota archaeon]|nr:hypothetical protein [Candidatus Pacearchaeota archaeon]
MKIKKWWYEKSISQKIVTELIALVVVLIILYFLVILPSRNTDEFPENKHYVSIIEAEEKILGNWEVLTFGDLINRDEAKEGTILRFEEGYIYAESFPNGDYYEGEWQVIEYRNDPYLIRWPKREIFKIIFVKNKLYLVNVTTKYFEFERMDD